jgi:malate dehydrogenase (oxaloacetate-decarboxylating)(NADP+)
VSTVSNLFNQAVVEAMARHNAQPIIFPLSNPTEKMELMPDNAYKWTNGTCVYAGGVQLPIVHLNGHTYVPSQANNLYIFPAVGLAILATNAKVVTDEMFIEAAHAVADQVTAEQLKLGMLFPAPVRDAGGGDPHHPPAEADSMAMPLVTSQYQGIGILGPPLCWCWPRNGS